MGNKSIKTIKISKEIKNEFKDIIYFTEKALKEVWDNPEDEIYTTT